MDTMSECVSIDPPVRGQWAIFNPPWHPKLAFDFLAVDDRKSPYTDASLVRHLLWRIRVENTLAWGKPVHAVLPGTVVEASDGVPDRPRLSMLLDLAALMFFAPKVAPPFSRLGGNYVVLDCGEVFPLYAHLRCGSVRVKSGQRVEAGEQLGEVGNSGSSLQPHLHFQVMNSPDPFPLFQNLMPFALSTVRRKVGSGWQVEVDRMPRNGDHYLAD